jgi:hypothetical protein
MGHLLATALLALLLASCASDAARGDASAEPATPCSAAKISECVGSQQACVSDAQGARCVACSEGQYAALTGQCEPLGGDPMPHDFAAFTTMPGEEVLGLCQSWTLNNAEELWINGVVLEQDEASHHSNWTFVPDDKFDGPDGVWRCSERKYNELDAALGGGVLYAQSTQTPREVQRFPTGAAVRVPPYSRIIGDVHLLNATTAPITGHARLTLHRLPASDVTVKLVPFHLTYNGLNLPPHAVSRFTGNCAMDSYFPDQTLGIKVYYILPHTHALATRFFLDVLGGPHDGETLLETGKYDSGSHGRAFDPPFDMTGAEGFSFGCQYLNPRGESVKWGFGDQEMCELLGFAESPASFESRIETALEDGADGDVKLYSGKCLTLTFPWDFQKPGGSGPK